MTSTVHVLKYLGTEHLNISGIPYAVGLASQEKSLPIKGGRDFSFVAYGFVPGALGANN